MNGMGAARLPKHTEFSNTSVSLNFFKWLRWRYTQSAQRASPPPRLLLVFVLSVQILLLGIVRFGPGGALWTLRSADGLLPSSSMSESVLVGRAMGIHPPLKLLPQGREDSLVLPDGEREAWMLTSSLPSSSTSLPSTTSTSPSSSTSFPSPFAYDVKDSDSPSSDPTELEQPPTIADLTNVDRFVVEPAGSEASSLDSSNRSSPSEDMAAPTNDNTIENEGIEEIERTEKDAFEGVHSAAAMATSVEAAKKDKALITQKVSESIGEGEGDELLVGVQDKPVVKEELTPPVGMETASTSDIHSTLDADDAHTSQSESEKREEHVATASQDAAHNVLLVEAARIESAPTVTERSGSSGCKYGYIYVYDLPPVFNYDIIANCTALNIFLDVCRTLLNSGLGASLGDASPLGQTGSWFVSDQFTAEVVFHNRMLQHPCRTDKVDQASGFYVPYYAGLDVGRYLWAEFSAERRDRVGDQLLDWLGGQEAWKRNGGWGHFMMIGRITWDFRRSKDEDWGSGIFYRPSMQNMTRLLIERNPWDYMEMAVPYPTNFHPQSDADLITWQNHIRSIKRSYLFSFAGAPRSTFPNDFRGILLDQCQHAQSCQSLDCSNRTCDNNQKTLELFMDSSFCLQPRGDSFTRRSTFDCLLAGTIPVFFWHRSAYMQYKWHLPEDVGSYSVFISKEDMRNGTKIEDVLNSFSTEKVQAMREVVIEMVPRLVYAVSGFSLKEKWDAFDIAIEGVMKRFKDLNLSSQRR